MKTGLFYILLLFITYCAAGQGVLEIYLPREITVNSNAPNLGDVAVIRGDEALVSKAETVSLGKISTGGQKVTIEKSIIAGRLVCSGIPASQVKLTGAEKITISQKHQIISGKEFVDKAAEFLSEHLPHSDVCQYKAVRTPKDLIITDVNSQISFKASLADSRNNQATVIVSVFSNDRQIDWREVVFSLKYNCNRAVAAADITAGTILNSENVKIENYISNQPQREKLSSLYGLAAKKNIPANSVITMDLVENVKPELVVKRNQNVIIKVDRMGLLVTALGKTLQDGRVGDCIKVQNLSSQRIIIAKVKEDGSVEPVF